MAKREMVVNYVPGEECRVAVIEDNKLEEFHAERADSVSHVGNIYLGTVVNVEPAIQAAFVDFGLDASGFLHVSDLHPRYFPGEDSETTEMVGKKTPRRERPPIQHCLRRGQEIAVQVLKEGVGTKGPTVTSYLSIPGRFLVMMPLMDRVGVSRKVEDEDTRRKMREILDQLDLPDGFGFILRTAGLERTKLELKRDLAYLQRLWKDMERRWKKGARPRLLYSEQDLLVRSLRDMLTTEIDRIVIDHEGALRRAARFLKIVAPRSAANLVHYTAKTPIFSAMGIEQQIRNIHSREVPLPSGGRLVIDETEALVAIDVNSGKSREARDAETNAYETNLEAVDEIARQLRLRDLGGIVVNDLIDMRMARHRKEVENRFKEKLKNDRARSTLAPISEFGILEMTRQRMRGSHESVHFGECTTCRGRGLVQKADSVAADAMRDLATLLEFPKIAKVEMVVSPRIAGELLSTKRRALNRLERTSGKTVDVRISEAIAVDRVTFYAYDERGADIDVARLPSPRADSVSFRPWAEAVAAGDDWAVHAEEEAAAVAALEPPEPEPDAEFESMMLPGVDQMEPEPELDAGGKKKRRRRRRGRGREEEGGQVAPPPQAHQRPPVPEQRPAAATPFVPAVVGAQRLGDHGDEDEAVPDNGAPHANGAPPAARVDGADGAPLDGDGRRGRRRRRRRGGRGRGREGAAGQSQAGGGFPSGEEHERGAPVPADGRDDTDADTSPIDLEGEGLEVGYTGPSESRRGPGAHDDEDGAENSAPAESGGEGEPADDQRPEGRRKRRRRRGGRGRGRGASELAEDSGEPGAAPAKVAEELDPVVGDVAHAEEPDGPAAHQESETTEPGEDGEPRVDKPGADDEPTGGRRRRRRRGRGGRGGGETGGPAPAQPQPEPKAAGQPEGGRGGGGRGRGSRGGGGGGGGRGGDRAANPPQSAPGAKAPTPKPAGGKPASPKAAPAADAPPAPKAPRTLYAFRRKLAPSELGKVKGRVE